MMIYIVGCEGYRDYADAARVAEANNSDPILGDFFAAPQEPVQVRAVRAVRRAARALVCTGGLVAVPAETGGAADYYMSPAPRRPEWPYPYDAQPAGMLRAVGNVVAGITTRRVSRPLRRR